MLNRNQLGWLSPGGSVSVAQGYQVTMNFNSGAGEAPAAVYIYCSDEDNDFTVTGDDETVWHTQKDFTVTLTTDSVDVLGSDADFGNWQTTGTVLLGSNPTSVIPSVGSGSKTVHKTYTLPIGGPSAEYVFKGIFNAAAGSDWVFVYLSNTDSAEGYVWFDVANGTKGTVGGTILVSSSIDAA